MSAASADLGDLLESLGSLEHDVFQIHHRLESCVSEAKSNLEEITATSQADENVFDEEVEVAPEHELDLQLSENVSAPQLQALISQLEEAKEEFRRLQAERLSARSLHISEVKKICESVFEKVEEAKRTGELQYQVVKQEISLLKSKIQQGSSSAQGDGVDSHSSDIHTHELEQQIQEKESKILTLQSALDKLEKKASSELSQLQYQLRVTESQYSLKLSELESKLQSAEHASSKPVRAGLENSQFEAHQDDDEVFVKIFNTINTDGNTHITGQELDEAIMKEKENNDASIAVGFRALKDLVQLGNSSGIALEDFKAACRRLPRLSGQRLHWAQNLGLDGALAKRLHPGTLFDGLQGIREMTHDELSKACSDFCLEVLDIVVEAWERLRSISSKSTDGPPLKTETELRGDHLIQSVMSKFSDSGGFMGKFGDANLFHTGLEKELGYPNPDILKSILREHVSTDFFVTGNYGISTSDYLEFVRMFMVEDSRGLPPLSFLKEISESKAVQGPDIHQVKEIEAELKKMEATHLQIQKERNGIFSGEPNDSYSLLSVKLFVRMASKDDCSTLTKAAAKEGDLAGRLTSKFFEDPSFEKSLRAAEAKARGVSILVPPMADGVDFTVTLLIPVIKAGVEWSADEISSAFEHASKFFVTGSVTANVLQAIPKNFRFVEKIEKITDENLILKQGRLRRSVRELMSINEVKEAALRVEEAIVAYLYTGPLFQKWNWVLRNLYDLVSKKSRYTTTIHVLVSAAIKLAQNTKVPFGRNVYRGLGGVVLDEKWFTPDARGTRGGVELGFLSTTLNKRVALEYSGVKQKRGIVLEIDVGAIDCGAQLDFISQYPGEGELIFGPLSYLEVVGQPHFDHFDGDEVVVISVKINVNLKAQKIEDMIAKRKEIHKASFRFMVDDVRYDLFKTVEEQGSDALKLRVQRDVSAKDDFQHTEADKMQQEFFERFVENSIMKQVEQTRRAHEEKSAEDFLSNDIYRSLVLELLDSGSMARSKLRLYLEDPAQIRLFWDTLPLKVSHRSLLAFLKRTLPPDDVLVDVGQVPTKGSGARFSAILSLCKLKGLIVKSADEKNEYDETRLMQAAADGLSLQDIKLLGEAGVQINDSDKLGNTAFLLAAQFGHAEILVALHQLKADIAHCDQLGECALHKTAINGHVDCLITLCDLKADMNQLSCKSQTEKRLPCGMNAMMFASMYGHSTCMKTLKRLGTNVNYKQHGGPESPGSVDATFWAASLGHADCVQAMADMGVNMEPLVESVLCDALFAASQNNFKHVVSLLHTLRGWTPLMIALSELESDDLKLKEFFIEVKDDDDDTSIVVADGVDVNVRNKSQRSALHYAAMADKDAIVVALIKANADINVLDIYSKSPLDYCEPHSDTIVVLKQSGADGWTALMVAAELGDTEWNHYFELREALLSQQDRLPFPDGFERCVDGLNSVEKEDQIIGLDNSLWTEEADSLMEDIHKAGTITDHNSAEMHRLGALFVHRAQEKVGWDFAGSRGSSSPMQPKTGGRQSMQKNSPKSLGALFVRFQALAALKKMLSEVAGQGSPQKVQSLILNRTDINAQKRDRCTALHIAARSGHEGCVQQLIELKADIDSKDIQHRNALHYAAKYGKVNVILTLVKLRADINATDRKGLSALDLASGSKTCSQLLKKLGAGGWTPLMVALDQGGDFPEKYFKMREAALCMKRGFPFPSWFQTEIRTHLSSSLISEGDKTIGLDNLVWTDEENCVLERLPNAGNLVEYDDREMDRLKAQIEGGGPELLHNKSIGAIAVRFNALAALRHLLDSLVETDYIHHSSSSQVFERGEGVVRMLGLKVDDTIVEKQKRFTLQRILTGNDINAVNKDLQTALHIACLGGGEESVRTLVELNADIKAMDVNQRTPLHYAVLKDEHRAVQTLLDFHADVNIRDMDGFTPLDLAVSSECIDALVKQGACGQVQFKCGDTVQFSKIFIRNLSFAESEDLPLEDSGIILDIEGDENELTYSVSFFKDVLRKGDLVAFSQQA